MEDKAELKRRDARDNATIGGAGGLHLPGILPEPDVIEAEDSLSPQEQAILDDLREALPESDREPENPVASEDEGVAAAEAAAHPAQLQRQRAELPWWNIAGEFWIAGAFLMAIGLVAFVAHQFPIAILLIVIGVASFLAGIKAYRVRKERAGVAR